MDDLNREVDQTGPLRLVVDNPDPVNESAVALLQKILGMAERGEVTSVGIALVYADGRVGQCIDVGCCFHHLNSSVATLQHTLNQRFLECGGGN